MIENIVQISILILSSIAMMLVGSVNFNTRKWSYILGFIGNPLWLYSAIMHEQWGMALTSVFYTIGWTRGVYNHWFVNPESKTEKELRIYINEKYEPEKARDYWYQLYKQYKKQVEKS